MPQLPCGPLSFTACLTLCTPFSEKPVLTVCSEASCEQCQFPAFLEAAFPLGVPRALLCRGREGTLEHQHSILKPTQTPTGAPPSACSCSRVTWARYRAVHGIFHSGFFGEKRLNSGFPTVNFLLRLYIFFSKMKEFHFEIEKTSFVRSILHALLTVSHVWTTFT